MYFILPFDFNVEYLPFSLFVKIFAVGVESELSLVHPDDVDWFITLDETHHELTTRGNKGGLTTIRYANSLFARSGDRLIETSSHTTGVYSFTLCGKSLPPLYILSSGATNEDNYKFYVLIRENLPEVVASHGQALPSSHPSRIAVRRKEEGVNGYRPLVSAASAGLYQAV